MPFEFYARIWKSGDRLLIPVPREIAEAGVLKKRYLVKVRVEVVEVK